MPPVIIVSHPCPCPLHHDLLGDEIHDFIPHSQFFQLGGLKWGSYGQSESIDNCKPFISGAGDPLHSPSLL